jgi:uncharacterized protein YndB with AHSA1/START domain
MPLDIDPIRHLGTVSRVVSSRERDGRPARVVVATRTYDTTPDDLWDALTSIERIPRWFLPIEGDLRLGGRYQFQGNAGGTITTCEPPRHLAVTWEFGGQVSWVDVRLAPDAKGGTRLELEHVAHVPPEMWDQYGPGAVGVGWDSGLLGLANHIATGASMSPSEGMAWLGSDQGKAFVRATSDDWCRASIAAGTDADAARAAADRTTAAYTATG